MRTLESDRHGIEFRRALGLVGQITNPSHSFSVGGGRPCRAVVGMVPWALLPKDNAVARSVAASFCHCGSPAVARHSATGLPGFPICLPGSASWLPSPTPAFIQLASDITLARVCLASSGLPWCSLPPARPLCPISRAGQRLGCCGVVLSKSRRVARLRWHWPSTLGCLQVAAGFKRVAS